MAGYLPATVRGTRDAHTAWGPLRAGVLAGEEDRVTREEQSHRALIASRIFAPEPAAASLWLSVLAQELAGAGYDVEVLTTTAPGSAPPNDPAGVHVVRWPAVRNADGYIRGYLGYLSFDIPLVFRLLLRPRPDVVICEPPPTTGVAVRVACALRRIPYLYGAADLWSEAVREVGVPSVVQRVLARVERWALAGATQVLTVNPELVGRIRHLGVRRPITLIGYGADTTIFRPDGPTAVSGRPYLVYAGTASEVHGARIFTRAMPRVLEEVPDALVVFIGQGTERSAMEEDARALPTGSVEFHARLDPSATAAWLRGARAALASVRPGPYGFAIATKLYAATGCGTPVVNVGPGPGRDLVRDNHLGWDVDYDVGRVAEAMVAALRTERNPEDVERLSTWTGDHASLQAAARRAVACVDDVVRRAVGQP